MHHPMPNRSCQQSINKNKANFSLPKLGKVKSPAIIRKSIDVQISSKQKKIQKKNLDALKSPVVNLYEKSLEFQKLAHLSQNSR